MKPKKLSGKSRIYLRPPVSYYGGKQGLLRDILPIIPAHRKYVEPFLGGGAVYWAKEPSEIEVINDMDGFVVNFYKVIKTDFSRLRELVESNPYGRESHDKASVIRQTQEFFTPAQRAWAFFVLANSSMYSILSGQCVTPGQDAKPAKTFYNKVERFTEEYSHRLINTFIEQRDAVYVVQKNDSEDTCFFVDPPYFNSDMGHYKGYTEDDFKWLLETLALVKGKFILTCYPSEIADFYASKHTWNVVDREMSLSAGSRGKRKTERIIMNY